MATTKLYGQQIYSGSIPTTALSGGVVSSSIQIAASVPAGTVSSSVQVNYNSITNKLSGVVSASAQVAPLLPAGTVSSSAQVVENIAGQTIAPSVIGSASAGGSTIYGNRLALVTTGSTSYKIDVQGTVNVRNANSDYFRISPDSNSNVSQAVLVGQSTAISLFANPQATTQTGFAGDTYSAQSAGIISAGPLVLGANQSERLRINSAGNVGIGTTSPSYTLDVQGTLGVTGAATFSSTLGVTGLATFSSTGVFLANITVGNNGTTLPKLSINGTDATFKMLEFQSVGVTKWDLYANTSADHAFRIDSATVNVLNITQAGAWTIPGALAIAGAFTGATTGAFSGAVSMAGLTATTGTFSGAVSMLNASSANTASYFVQRDSNGDFAGRNLTVAAILATSGGAVVQATNNITTTAGDFVIGTAGFGIIGPAVSRVFAVGAGTNPTITLGSGPLTGISTLTTTGLASIGGAIAMGGALTGATTGAFSGAVSMAGLTATTGTFSGDVAYGTNLTGGVNSLSTTSSGFHIYSAAAAVYVRPGATGLNLNDLSTGTTLIAGTSLTVNAVTTLFNGAISTGLGVGIAVSGPLTAGVDATYDFGTSGAYRFRDGYLSRNLAIGGALTGATTGAFSGAVSMAGLTATTVSASGLITSSIGNNLRVFQSASATTGYQLIDIYNSGARLFLGIEGSSGGGLASGTSGYATVLSSQTNYALDFGTNNTRRGGFSAAGAFDVTGAIAMGGALTGATTGAFSGTITATVTASAQAIFKGYATSAASANQGLIQIGGNATNNGIIQYDYDTPVEPTFYIDNTRNTVGAPIVFRHRTSGTAVVSLTLTGDKAAVFGGAVSTGALTATTGTFSSTLGVTGAATFSSTVDVAGQLTFSGTGYSTRYVAGSNATYGTAMLTGWYRSDGTTLRAWLGYASNNDQVFYVGPQESGGTVRITSGAGTTAISIDSAQAATFSSTLGVTGNITGTAKVESNKIVVGLPAVQNDSTGVANTLQLANYSAGAFVIGSADNYIYKTSNVFGGIAAQSTIFQTRSDTTGGGWAWVAGSTPAVVASISSAGAATFSSSLAINGAFTGATTGAFSGAVSTGALTATTGSFSGTLAVTGAATFSSDTVTVGTGLSANDVTLTLNSRNLSMSGIVLQNVGVTKWQIVRGLANVNDLYFYNSATAHTVLRLGIDDSATFSSTLATSGLITSTSDTGGLQLRNTANTAIGYVSNVNNMVGTGATTDMALYAVAAMKFYTGNNAVVALSMSGGATPAATFGGTLAVTGAATFSSTVTGTAFYSSGISNSPYTNSGWLVAPASGGLFIINSSATAYFGLKSDNTIQTNCNTTIGGALAVTGAAQFASTVSTGALTTTTAAFSSTVTLAQDIQYSSNSGYGILSADSTRVLAIRNTGLNVTGTLAVTGASTLTGNVGVGAAPLSAVADFFKLNVGANMSMFANNGVGSVGLLMQNANYDGANYVRINTDLATRYYANAGQHTFSHAVTGTAGTNISWVDDFTISPTGAATFSSTLGVAGVATFSAGSTSVVMNATSTYNAIRFNQSGGAQGFIGSDYGQTICSTSANGDMVLRADATGTILFASSTVQIAKLTSTAATFSGTVTGGLVGKTGTYTPGSTTVDVTGVSYMVISNTSAISITNFTGAVNGQILILDFEDSNTTITRNNAYLLGGNNFTSTGSDTLVLVFHSPYWREISRSVNS